MDETDKTPLYGSYPFFIPGIRAVFVLLLARGDTLNPCRHSSPSTSTCSSARSVMPPSRSPPKPSTAPPAAAATPSSTACQCLSPPAQNNHLHRMRNLRPSNPHPTLNEGL